MKYGWEICDEVQRFVSNTSEIQFVPYSDYRELSKLSAQQGITNMNQLEENKKLRDTLKLIAALIEEQDESDRTITEIEIYANAVNTLAALASHNGTTGQVE